MSHVDGLIPNVGHRAKTPDLVCVCAQFFKEAIRVHAHAESRVCGLVEIVKTDPL